MYRNDSDGLDAARAQLVRYSARLLDDGLAVGSAGNMSVRIGDRVAITPSGISYTEMRPEDICLVGMDGAELQSSETPSSETPMHLAIYAATKAGAGAVVHTHSPEVIALSAGRDELPAIHYAITGLGGPVRVAPYVRFGSAGLAASAVTALDGRSAVILRNHGAVTYGRDLTQAYDRALLLEWLARTYRLALSYGEPAILSAAELDEVTAESRRRRYGERRAEQASHESPEPGQARAPVHPRRRRPGPDTRQTGLLIGAPDALAGTTGEELADVARTARSHGALVAVDVLHPGRPQDLDRLAPLLAQADWFLPNADQLLALTGRATSPAPSTTSWRSAPPRGRDLRRGRLPGRRAPGPRRAMSAARPAGRGGRHHRLRRRLHRGMLAGLLAGAAPEDAAWLGVACGALVATGLGSDAGIENLGQVLDFLERTQPAAAGRIKEHIS